MKKQTLAARLTSALAGLTGIAVAGLFVGCAPTGFSMKSTPGETTSASAPSAPTAAGSTCAVDATDYAWDVNIFGFGLSGSNFSVGYSGRVAGPVSHVAAGLKVDRGTLNLEMDSVTRGDSIPRHVPGSATKKSGFNFNIDVGIATFGLGSNSDAQSAMMKLTQASFDDLMTNAAQVLTDRQNPWSTRVTSLVSGSFVQVPVGAIAGIQYGDEFAIYRYHEVNNGCVGNGYTELTPLATFVPAPNGIHDSSTILIPTASLTMPVSVNDLVVVSKLTSLNQKSARAPLKKSVRIQLHQPNLISVDAGSVAAPIDLTSYLRYQMGPAMNSSQFWLVP